MIFFSNVQLEILLVESVINRSRDELWSLINRWEQLIVIKKASGNKVKSEKNFQERKKSSLYGYYIDYIHRRKNGLSKAYMPISDGRW